MCTSWNFPRGVQAPFGLWVFFPGQTQGQGRGTQTLNHFFLIYPNPSEKQKLALACVCVSGGSSRTNSTPYPPPLPPGEGVRRTCGGSFYIRSAEPWADGELCGEGFRPRLRRSRHEGISG